MYQIHELLKFPELFHAFSTKDDGNMANFIMGNLLEPESILKNREKFLKKIGIDINLCICMWVEGGDEIKIADSKDKKISMIDYQKAVKADALITSQKETYLFLLTADCAPVILFDPVKEVVAVVHIGWRGADLEIIKKAIKRLEDSFKINPKDLVVGIGPAARRDSFIKESPLQKSDQKWKSFLEPIGNNRYKVDFVGLFKKQIVDSGIKEANIFDCKIDTVKDERFFSHVREGKLPLARQGRFACVVGLK